MSREPGRTLNKPPSCCWMCVLKCVSGGWAGEASGWQGHEDEQAWGSAQTEPPELPLEALRTLGQKVVGSGDGWLGIGLSGLPRLLKG